MSCPDCFKGGIHDHRGDAKGHEEEIHGLRTYVASPSPSSTSKSTIIFITDAFGLELINNKLLADRYAAGTGFRVLVPDVIPGGPASIAVMNPMESIFEPVKWFDIWGQIKRIGYVLTTMRYMVPFFIRANPTKPATVNSIVNWTRKVKKDLPPGAKLGICGFCWGGYQSTHLSAKPSVEDGTEPLIDAQFCAHPSALKPPGDIVNAITKFKVPYSIAVGLKDFVFTPKQGEETEAVLREKAGDGKGENDIHYEFKYYEGCAHGFAVRAKVGDTVQEKGAEDACEQAITWFKKWL
jgi:dienelactone hydrolase